MSPYSDCNPYSNCVVLAPHVFFDLGAQLQASGIGTDHVIFRTENVSITKQVVAVKAQDDSTDCLRGPYTSEGSFPGSDLSTFTRLLPTLDWEYGGVFECFGAGVDDV